jgi:hypothetical protein
MAKPTRRRHISAILNFMLELFSLILEKCSFALSHGIVIIRKQAKAANLGYDVSVKTI